VLLNEEGLDADLNCLNWTSFLLPFTMDSSRHVGLLMFQ